MTTIAVRNFHTIPSVKWPTSVSMNGWSMLPSNAPSKFGTSKPQGFREDPGNAWDLHENISDMMVGLSRTEALILSIHKYIYMYTCVCTSYSCGCATFRRAQMKFLMEGWLVILPMLPPTLSPFKEKHTAEKIGTPFQKITEAFLPSSGHRCVSKKIALPWSSPSKSPVKSAPSKAL